MALVQKRNPVRNALFYGILAVVVVAGLLYLFRDRLFPAQKLEDTTTNIHVRQLPVYPTSGAEVLNTNVAGVLTPHGPESINVNSGRDNPFQPLNTNGG